MKASLHVVRDRDAQAGLADPRRADQRQQPRLAAQQHIAHRGDVLFAADQARERRGQVGRRPLGRVQRSVRRPAPVSRSGYGSARASVMIAARSSAAICRQSASRSASWREGRRSSASSFWMVIDRAADPPGQVVLGQVERAAARAQPATKGSLQVHQPVPSRAERPSNSQEAGRLYHFCMGCVWVGHLTESARRWFNRPRTAAHHAQRRGSTTGMGDAPG